MRALIERLQGGGYQYNREEGIHEYQGPVRKENSDWNRVARPEAINSIDLYHQM